MRKRSTDTAREGMMMGEDRFPPVVVKNWTLVFDLNSATAALILMVLLSPCIGSPPSPLPPNPSKKLCWEIQWCVSIFGNQHRKRSTTDDSSLENLQNTMINENEPIREENMQWIRNPESLITHCLEQNGVWQEQWLSPFFSLSENFNLSGIFSFLSIICTSNGNTGGTWRDGNFKNEGESVAQVFLGYRLQNFR